MKETETDRKQKNRSSETQVETVRLKQNTGKPRRDMDGQNWRGLRWIAFGYI